MPNCLALPCDLGPRQAGICPKYPFPRILRLHFGQCRTTSACFCEDAIGLVRFIVTASRPYSSMSHFVTSRSIKRKFSSELCWRQNVSNARSVTEGSVILSSPLAIHLPTSTAVTPKSFAARPHEYASFSLHTPSAVVPCTPFVPFLRQNSAREIADSRGSRTLSKP